MAIAHAPTTETPRKPLGAGPIQVSDVLNGLIETHEALFLYYCREAARKPQLERHHLMRIAEREQKVCEGLRRFKMENQEGLLDTYVRFQSFPDLDGLRRKDAEEPTFKDSTTVLEVEEALHELTLGMSTADAPPRIQELFENILELEGARLRQKSLESLLDQDV